jgi:hypothetical protein
MPKLTAICYRLFDGEESSADSAARGEIHEFGGELALTFDDGQRLFVSWVSEPVQYAIGVKDASHFVPEARLTDFEVSDSVIWAGLVGQEVSLQYVGYAHQILEVSSATDSLFLCSFERGGWWADAVTVCKQTPAMHGA